MREVKWGKTPKKEGKYYDGYKALIEAFRDLDLAYKALIIDTRRYPLKHRLFTFGSSELGYYKFFYQLLYSGIIKRNNRINYHVYLDRRPKEDVGSVSTLEECIYRAAFRDDFPEVGQWRCCDIQEADSKVSPCLQLVDLLTGAVGARWNQAAQTPTKLGLINFVEHALGVDMRVGNMPLGNQKFNLWLFKSTRWEAKQEKKWPT